MSKNKTQHPAASLPLADDVILDGVQTGVDVKFTKGDIIAGALARTNHTGEQAISTVTGLQTALNGKAEDAAVVKLSGAQTVADIKTFSSAPVVPDNSWTISDTSGLQTALDAKAADSAVMKLTGDQTAAGVKTFSSSPVVPTPTTSTQAANKSYVDSATSGTGIRVEDEGTSVVAAATGINFAGTGVTVTDAGSNEALVTIGPSTGAGVFFVRSATGVSVTDRANVAAAVTAALSSGQTAAVIDLAGGEYDVGDLGIKLPKYGGGPQLTFRGPFLTTLKFSIDRGAGTWAVSARPVWTATVTGAPTGGTFSLNVTVDGVTQKTVAIAFNASAATVDAAIEALSNVEAGDVTVTGAGPYVITFAGTLVCKAVTVALADNNLTGGASPTVTVQESRNENDLYFHTFDGVGLAGPGARGTVGQPPVNIIGGGPTLMSGIWCGSRMRLMNGGVSGFRAGVQIMGNHILLRAWNCPNNLDGVYWAQTYGNSGDVLFDNCALDGNLRSSHTVAVASIATFKMLKGHLGFSPYAIYFEAGRTGASAIAMGGVQLDGTSVEFVGNGFIFDPSQFARVVGFHCVQVGTWSTSPVTYRIPASAADSWIKVFEFSGVSFEGGLPQDGSVSGGTIDGPLFDFTGTVRMQADTWKAEYATVVAAAQPWMLSTLPPKVILTDSKDDSEARALKAAQTVTAGQLLEHNGQTTYAVRPYGHFGAGIRGIYAGAAMNGATGDTRTCVICVTRGDRIPVLIDTVAANSYHIVADGTVAGKAVGIVYDGTNTSTNGRPLIGEAYFGPLVATTTSDIHLTGA